MKRTRKAARLAATIEAWERRVQAATERALRQWLPAAQAAVLRAERPDPTGVTATSQQWQRAVREHLSPELADLMAHQYATVVLPHLAEVPTAAEQDAPEPTGATGQPLTFLDDEVQDDAPGGSSFTIEWGDDDLPAAGTATLIPDDQVDHFIGQEPEDRISRYLRTVENRMVDFPDETFRLIAAELDEGIREQETMPQLAARVAAYLDPNGTGWANQRVRAARVAQTEVTGAFNAINLETERDLARVTGETTEKEWVATQDGHTRASHAAADGQRRGLDDPFTVGGAQLLHPGAPGGRADEVIGCRCAMLFHPIDTGLTAASTEESTMTVRTFTDQVLAPLGEATGDGRIFAANMALDFRQFPLPLFWQTKTSMGHDEAVIVGALVSARIEGGKVLGSGNLLDAASVTAVNEVMPLLDNEGGPLVYPSVDLCDAEWSMVDEDGNEVSEDDLWAAYESGTEIKVLQCINSAQLMGATLVGTQAFAAARIELDPADAPADQETVSEVAALVASMGDAERPAPAAWFADPQLTGPTPLKVTADGQVYGHLATWGVCHLAVADRCLTAPHTATDYSYFHLHELATDEGSLAVGKLTVGGGHMSPKGGVKAALSHYDDACSTWASVRAGEDAHGIWVAGAVSPQATEAQLADAKGAPLSGDWRRVNGNLELVAALSVVGPGFPIVRAADNHDGQQQSLVAAGALPTEPRRRSARPGSPALVQDVARAAVREYAQGQQRSERARALAEQTRSAQVAAAARRQARADAMRAELTAQ